MAKNYGYTFSYNSSLSPSGRARMSKVYRTKSEASKAAKSFGKFSRNSSPRVSKATKLEYSTFTSLFQTGRI